MRGLVLTLAAIAGCGHGTAAPRAGAALALVAVDVVAAAANTNAARPESPAWAFKPCPSKPLPRAVPIECGPNRTYTLREPSAWRCVYRTSDGQEFACGRCVDEPPAKLVDWCESR